MFDTVTEVEGVLPNRPVDALYVAVGDSAMVFRVRWRIESYRDMRRMLDKVHTALKRALEEALIESPFPTQNLNLQVEQLALERISETLRGQDPALTET